MSKAEKVIQITARPAEAADLAVEVDGIVEARTVKLGDSVTAFDFAGFYAILGSTKANAGFPAQLTFASQAIRSYGPVASSALLNLRVESLKAALDKAVLARENAFYSKYGKSSGIAAIYDKFYAPNRKGSKWQRLERLSKLANNRNSLLEAAYVRDHRTGVVESTTSRLTGHTASTGSSDGTSQMAQQSASDGTEAALDTTTTVSTANSHSTGTEAILVGQPQNTVYTQIDSSDSLIDDSIRAGRLRGTRSDSRMAVDAKSHESGSLSGDSQWSSEATQSSDETQTVETTGYDYQTPSIDANAQNERAQNSLIDEQVDHFIDIQKLPNLQQIFEDELKMIDLDVKLLQVAYLNTILLPPISGVVTGVFADVGDSVRAGEVLVRVENNTKVFLEATLVYRGTVSVGNTVTVQTDLFSTPGNSVTISGTVVAARGDTDDDRWNIVVNCDNRDSKGQEILPLHYTFDRDTTSITIS